MRLHINNIGGLSDADIVIEGITIIAGENNVGKSTIGKSVYAFLNNMDTWRETYEKQCQTNIVRYLNSKNTVLEDLCMSLSGAIRRRTNKVQAIECFSDLNGIMDCLNVYKITQNNKGNVVENLSYSEYGMTELYGDLSAPLDELEELLSDKYGIEEQQI